MTHQCDNREFSKAPGPGFPSNAPSYSNCSRRDLRYKYIKMAVEKVEMIVDSQERKCDCDSYFLQANKVQSGVWRGVCARLRIPEESFA